MNQLLEHIEKHPSETQRLLGLSYEQLTRRFCNFADRLVQRP
ncbi:hypothetical protein QUA42_17250 [Microcoleus sp. Pol11C2]